VVLYFDDGIVAAKEAARIASNRVRQDLALAGLIANEFKSQLEPVQRLIWLGFKLNLEIGISTSSGLPGAIGSSKFLIFLFYCYPPTLVVGIIDNNV